MLSSNQVVYGSLIEGARQVLAQTPETIGRFGIDRIRHHAKRYRANLAGRIVAPFHLIRDQRGDVAVLAIDPAHAVKLRTRCAPDAGRRPLLDRLQAFRRVKELTPSFCLMLQGTKKLRLGQDILQYHVGDYLASVIDIPAPAQVIGATKQSPYIGLRIDFTTKEIASVVMEAEINVKPQENKLNIGAFIGKSDADLLDAYIRLLKLLDTPKEARFLSALIKREMIFYLLSGDSGHFFFQQVLFDQQADGVGKAIAWIKEHGDAIVTRPIVRISRFAAA
jgi:AraC-type transcriptional regulator N-terminus